MTTQKFTFDELLLDTDDRQKNMKYSQVFK